jgi:hypothetical protein
MEPPPGVRTITAADTSTPAFLGRAATGPGTPTLVHAWDEFAAAFWPDPEADGCYLADAVNGFFANGGASCYIVRLDDRRDPYAAVLGDHRTGTGLAGLAAVPEVSAVVVPDLWSLPVDDPRPLVTSVVEHCARAGDRVALLDAPPGVPDGRVRDALPRLDPAHASFAAVYHPWVLTSGPYGEGRVVPPSGHVAGMWARTDHKRGVHKPPANDILLEVLDLTSHLDDEQWQRLADKGVNCLRASPERGALVWGARTLAADGGPYRSLQVRRLMCFLTESIRRSTTWAAFEPHDERLRSALRSCIRSFLTDQWRQGALHGRTPEQAFRVVCDGTNNDAATVTAGTVVCDVHVAPVRPVDFVSFRVQQLTGDAATHG